MSLTGTHRSIRFGPKPKAAFRRTYVDEQIARQGNSDGPTTSIEWTWDAAVPRMTSRGSRFENPQVRFYSEKQCKVNGFGRASPGPVHAPYSDFGRTPPLPADHWLMKNSPLVRYERELAEERKAKLHAPVLGRSDTRPSTVAGGASRPSTRASAARPISRAGTSLSRPSTVGGGTSGMGSTTSLAAPRTRRRAPAASALFPYANADLLPERAAPLPRALR